MKYSYEPKGVCTALIEFEIDEGVLHNVVFYGGCDGNTKGISVLVEGRDALRVMQDLMGIDCEGKGTSCPAALADGIKLVTDIKP